MRLGIGLRLPSLASLTLLASLSAGCATATAPLLELAGALPPVSCRTPLAHDGIPAAYAIAWAAPMRQQDRDTLDAWCRSTGPPVIVPGPAAPAVETPASAGIDELVVVSWNLHVGAADLTELVRRLRLGAFTEGVPVPRFVLLLQEAYRDDPIVPRRLPHGVQAPKAVGLGGRGRTDVVRLAKSLGLALYYAPSMRNGSPLQTSEDRGNAILSTETLTEFTAIELPFERQRRVAIAATVSSRDASGAPFTLRVASVHLDNTASARRLWLLANGARARQARELLDALRPHESLIVGGDFNTWFGFSDPTYKIVASALSDSAAGDRRRTFRGLLRLDHVFSKPPVGWTVTARRLDTRLGSDHYPMLARVQRPIGPAERQSP